MRLHRKNENKNEAVLLLSQSGQPLIYKKGGKRVELSGFFKRVEHYITVPFCVHCKRRLDFGMRVFCADCLSRYQNVKLRSCSRCASVLSKCTCANDYLDTHLVHKLIKIVRYVSSMDDLPQNRLIFSLKRENREDVAKFCAEELAAAITAGVEDLSDFVLSYVPRRPKNRRKYGVDQARILAEHIGKLLNIPVVHALRSRARASQKKLNAQERKANAVFVPKRGVDLSGKRVLLVDDIVTTGASMGSAAFALRSIGAREIVGVCFAIAYRDPYVPFEKPPYQA